jgi:hypothetical protein
MQVAVKISFRSLQTITVAALLILIYYEMKRPFCVWVTAAAATEERRTEQPEGAGGKKVEEKMEKIEIRGSFERTTEFAKWAKRDDKINFFMLVWYERTTTTDISVYA